MCQVHGQISHAATSGHGTLYACIQPVWPQLATTPTCTTLHRSTTPSPLFRAEPFHIIELSAAALHNLQEDDYRHIQGVENKFHDLHDLDLDYADSSVAVAALVTNGHDRQVSWFLMTHPHVPPQGSCLEDPACVSGGLRTVAASSSVGDSVVFPGHRIVLQNGATYYVCASLLPNDDTDLSGAKHLCGDGFLVDDDPPTPGTVVIRDDYDGYLTDGYVVAEWSGFHDVSAPYDVGALNYWVALGEWKSVTGQYVLNW